ncbi:TonB-dependent receptor, partial [Sesbania bispinosa]
LLRGTYDVMRYYVTKQTISFGHRQWLVLLPHLTTDICSKTFDLAGGGMVRSILINGYPNLLLNTERIQAV